MKKDKKPTLFCRSRSSLKGKDNICSSKGAIFFPNKYFQCRTINSVFCAILVTLRRVFSYPANSFAFWCSPCPSHLTTMKLVSFLEILQQIFSKTHTQIPEYLNFSLAFFGRSSRFVKSTSRSKVSS